MFENILEFYATNARLQSIINNPVFQFQKGQEALLKWQAYELTATQIEKIKLWVNNYSSFQSVQSDQIELYDIKLLFLEIVSYCDVNANGKRLYNQYEDKRTIAKAGVRMGSWINGLIDFKLNPDGLFGSTKNAFNYLLYPREHSTILSENHRVQIIEHYLQLPYRAETFNQNLLALFGQYNLQVVNPDNYTYLLSELIYHYELEWKKSKGMTFRNLVEQLNAVIREENLDFEPVGWSKNRKYVWLKDRENIIGDDIAHYEISSRTLHNNKIFVDIHFEGKKKEREYFYNNIQELPENLEWFDWWKSKSIGYKEEFSLLDKDIVTKVLSALEYFESTIGNQIRQLKIEKFPSSQNTLPSSKNLAMPLNQILYGPPGTGKTHNSINTALQLIDDEEVNAIELTVREDVKVLYDKKVEEGQIAFTTFHQSMSYEDFIEGIKPLKPNGQDKQVLYDVVPGLFKTLAAKALHNFILHAREGKKEKSYSFDEFHNNYLNHINQPANLNTVLFTTINDKELKLLSVNGTSIIVKFVWYNKAQGIEATQPFSVTKDKIRQLFEAGINPHEITNMKETFAPFFKHNLSVYYAVYKSFYDYVNTQGFDLSENEETSITLTEDFELLLDAYSLLTPVEIERGLAESQNYVLIIDEINRGNVSQIFGELITLIEDDKRLGKPEAIQVTLPYSKEKFGVPPNLYILGTMNTADRSVEALDTALRRRFSFTEMPPQYDLKELQGEVYGYPLHAILKKLNQHIEILLNRDHLIGHSYFLNKTEATLQESFYKNIIPLLQEYFYGDYQKIGMVLGKGFVRNLHEHQNSTVFASFETDYDYTDKVVYSIVNYADQTNVPADWNFEKALTALMS
ncbi:McrB family protein [Flavobacterium stagni]|uniref:ATPase dynein-related AAA domain-containing protein n=1 Tax=Flavobacterium stagni TaxID=2506421 RepID=A0A4Q1K342_9FLAO|nr:AAA family ATPase [Flavobacterium stagni]RXR20196.1 hypothetical protein EQG61_13175 [Flavobacterium stagni]